MILQNRLCRFLQDEAGSASIETVIIFPLLAWIFLATFVYFDAFRAKSINVKATYTISDILSREVNEPITPEFMDSLYALYRGLVVHTQPRSIRVTAIRYLQNSNTYNVIWSEVRGVAPLPARLTNANLATNRSTRLPVMYDGEVGILIETSSRYTPIFGYVGLAAFNVGNFMIQRPRFAPQICWSTSNDGPWTGTNQTC
jgi:Flp pilus assembly pilin Flp